MRKGFTLIELMISIIIIGVLLSMGYSQYSKAINSANAKKLVDQLNQIEAGLAEYYRDTGSYPVDLALLVNNKDIDNVDCYDSRRKAIGRSGDTYVMNRYSKKGYVSNMDATENGCIQAFIGNEICMGGIRTGGSLDSFSPLSNEFSGGQKNNCAPIESIGNGGNAAYHVLTVKGVEVDILENVFTSLVGQDIETYLASIQSETFKNVNGDDITPNAGHNLDLVFEAVDYNKKIGIPDSTNFSTQKAFVYKYRNIF